MMMNQDGKSFLVHMDSIVKTLQENMSQQGTFCILLNLKTHTIHFHTVYIPPETQGNKFQLHKIRILYGLWTALYQESI